MRDGLKNKHRETIIGILAANPRVERAVLFGSRAMETFTPQSDVDIALFGQNLSGDDQSSLSRKMEESSIPQRVDLLIHQNITAPKLLRHIKKHGKLLFQRDDLAKGKEASTAPSAGAGRGSAMASELEWATLADVSVDIAYGYTESATLDPVGPKFLRITDIQGGVVDWKSVPYCPITEDDHAKYKLESGDLVVARTGNSTGENYLYRGDQDAIFASYLIRFRLDRSRVDDRFVWYNLRTRSWWDFIASSKTGSAQAGANAKILGRFRLKLPPLKAQQAIADVLGRLDDKIELNRRMNRTLEKMAAAIFKSWFIDFDPVHAKAAGRDPALPAEIADLFPDRLEDSALGPIPKGWSVGPLSELASLQTKTIQPGKQPDVRWEHYSIPAYDEGQQPKRELGETIKSGKYAVTEGSVLVSKLNPQFPRIWLPWLYDAALAICSTEFMPFVPCDASSRPFVYEMMKSWPLQDAITARVTGSTGSRQRVKPKEIAELSVVVPPSRVIEAFSALVASYDDRLLLNQRQNRRLAALRDTLLPKLLSGEIEVPAAEVVSKEVS